MAQQSLNCSEQAQSMRPSVDPILVRNQIGCRFRARYVVIPQRQNTGTAISNHISGTSQEPFLQNHHGNDNVGWLA